MPTLALIPQNWGLKKSGKKTFLVREKTNLPPTTFFLHFEEHTALTNQFWECRMFSDFQFLHFLCKFAFSREIGPWEKKAVFQPISTTSRCDQNMNVNIVTSASSKRYIKNDDYNNLQQQNNTKKTTLLTTTIDINNKKNTRTIWYFVQWHQQL